MVQGQPTHLGMQIRVRDRVCWDQVGIVETIELDDLSKRDITPVVHVGFCQRDISQRRSLESTPSHEFIVGYEWLAVPPGFLGHHHASCTLEKVDILAVPKFRIIQKGAIGAVVDPLGGDVLQQRLSILANVVRCGIQDPQDLLVFLPLADPCVASLLEFGQAVSGPKTWDRRGAGCLTFSFFYLFPDDFDKFLYRLFAQPPGLKVCQRGFDQESLHLGDRDRVLGA